MQKSTIPGSKIIFGNDADKTKNQDIPELNIDNLYHKMFEEVRDYAMLLLDINGNILSWNQGAENIKGYAADEIIGKNFKVFYKQADVESKLPNKLIAEAYKNGRATHEGWRVRKNGSEFWGSIVITALHDNDGKIVGFSKVTRDLTQKKQFEDMILAQNKQLEEYAYVASHDLQEPLRKIMIFSKLVEANLSNPIVAAEYLEKVNSSAGRMSNLIRAVLQYSQAIDSIGLKINVDLNQVLKDIISDFDVLLAEKQGVIDCGELPTIKAIPVQMHQLFSNLIGNAIKFSSDAPKIIVAAKALSNSDNGVNMTSITVSDNGIGFEQDYSDKIFKMFHKLHDVNTGTGIGLALCRKIVESHGGTITASSNPGQGTTFEILLPTS